MRRAALVAMSRPAKDEGQIEVRSPGVGLWRNQPAIGAVIRPGVPLGEIETLGVLHPIEAPASAAGQVVSRVQPSLARVPVEYGEVLVVLDPRAADMPSAVTEDAGAGAVGAGRYFASPMSGRFYVRPAPDKPPFVAPGQSLKTGDTIGLLEVMKTFNRITYGGGGLPDEARVKRIVPGDGDDLNAGDPILELDVE